MPNTLTFYGRLQPTYFLAWETAPNSGLSLYFFLPWVKPAFFLPLSFYSSVYCRYFLTRVPILEERIQYKFANRFLLHQAVTHPSYKENFGTSADPIRYSDLCLENVLSSVGGSGSGISCVRIMIHGSQISNQYFWELSDFFLDENYKSS
jgi:hypothetical protein